MYIFIKTVNILTMTLLRCTALYLENKRYPELSKNNLT
jgi:hypothetical protein